MKILKIARSKIKTADYNPRVITQDSRERLKKGIEKFGMVELLVWNQQTGTLVGGHQRLDILDEMNDYPNNDYEVDVSVVHLNEKDEATLNVQLNNYSMMGSFDLGKLDELINNFDVNITDLGFSDFEVKAMFPEDDETPLGELEEDSEDVQETKSTLDQIKEERGNMNEKHEETNSGDFYFTVVCASRAEKNRLLNAIGVDEWESFVKATCFKQIPGFDF